MKNCPWREDELDIEGWRPSEYCKGLSCEGASVFAMFLKRKEQETIAMFSLLQTTFIVFLLASAAMSFSRDTQILVIAPIEKMVFQTHQQDQIMPNIIRQVKQAKEHLFHHNIYT